MRISKYVWLAVACVTVMATSCTTQRRLTYFRDIDAASADEINKQFQQIHESKIVTGDMLTIFVSSPDMTASMPFNLPTVVFDRAGSGQMSTQQTYQSYMVDINGDVEFPVLGKIHLAGMTKSQAHDFLVEKLQPYLKECIVTINYVNYKVSVMGEVSRPGQYTISNERVSIQDALSLAGDLTPYGKRDNVLVIREENGKLQFHRLNLNDDELFKSPYYFLQQNDIVYVSPNKVRAIASSNIGTYLSIISTLVTVTTLVITLSK